MFLGCQGDSDEYRALPDEITFHWSFNHVDSSDGSSKADFIVINNSNVALSGSDWGLYFNQIYPPAGVAKEDIPFRVETITGDYRRIVPAEDFGSLDAGDSVLIPVKYNGFAGRASYIPKGAYIARGEDDFALVKQRFSFPANNADPILEDIKREAFRRYEQNSRGYNSPDPAFGMVPSPKSIETHNRQIVMRQGIEIGCPTAFLPEARLLAEDLRTVFTGAININENATGGHIVFLRGTMSDPEGYSINTDNGTVEIIAPQGSGALYASKTLMRMIETSNYAGPSDQLTLTAVNIEDAPRFRYRGLQLDVSRNFISVEKVKRVIDQMSHYKLNKLLLTLTNDEGWRIEIQGLPELVQVGAKRGHTEDENDMLYPAYGSGPHPTESQYYTRDQFMDLLKYAAERHIDIIPEIDLPGHARAAIKAMQARNNDEYFLHDPKDTSKYSSAQNYSDNVVCVCRESTYKFIAKVITEVVRMYEESGLEPALIHSGGDEIPNGVWKGSPICNSLISETPGLTGVEDLQQYFLERFIEILAPYDLNVGGWEEIVLKTDERGHNTTEINFDLKSSPVRPYVWNSVWGWGREDMAYKLANAGYKVVMCNSGSLYFDLAYENHPSEPGLTWSGFVDTRSAFEFTPYEMFSTATEDRNGEPLDEEYIESRTRLEESARTNILGIQGQLWGETLDDPEMLDYYLFPKMLGLAERAWAGEPKWTLPADKSKRLDALEDDWAYFASVVGWEELPRLEYMFGGTEYRVPLPGVQVLDNTIFVNTTYPNVEIRYTTDGTDPEKGSQRVTSSVRIDGGDLRVRAFGSDGREGHVLRLGGR